jgi:hypothetical protein
MKAEKEKMVREMGIVYIDGSFNNHYGSAGQHGTRNKTSECSTHKPLRLPYAEKAKIQERRVVMGELQSQCAVCHRWFFPNEM